MTKAPLTFTLTLTGAQLEELADLVENKLSMVDVVDREDAAVARRLNDILDAINALGPLRERRVLAPRRSR
jgi:hypothetical protein